ncbi:MAG: hypothetical protein K9N23_09910, partial [Akkermansiaceae bacterium]|nr:hypothetical protein [Akkermansiaceae bacterium]
MKNQKSTPWALAIMHLVWLSSADAAVTFANSSSTTVLDYTGQTSSTDLINAGQSTLSSSTVSAVYNGGSPFPATGINNGNYSDSFTDNTFFAVANGNFPATATYDLNVTANVLGYDLTSI